MEKSGQQILQMGKKILLNHIYWVRSKTICIILFSDFGECEGSVNPADHEKRVHTSLLFLFPISVLKYVPFMAIYHVDCSPLPFMYSYGLHIKRVKINTCTTTGY